MALSESQKITFAFNFTVSNSSEEYIGYRDGEEERYGLKTNVFPNLKHTVDFENLSKSDAKNIHKKLVWSKFYLNQINDIEIAVKIYDMFFIFSSETVTFNVRDVLYRSFDRYINFENPVFGLKEVTLINELYEMGRGKNFIDDLISRFLDTASADSLKKRIKLKPTVD